MLLLTSTPDPGPLLLQYGPLGIICFLFVFGLIVGKPTVDRLMKERDSEREYSKKLEEQLRTQLIPLLTQWQSSTSDILKLAAEMKVTLEIEQRKRRTG